MGFYPDPDSFPITDVPLDELPQPAGPNPWWVCTLKSLYARVFDDGCYSDKSSPKPLCPYYTHKVNNNSNNYFNGSSIPTFGSPNNPDVDKKRKKSNGCSRFGFGGCCCRPGYGDSGEEK
ncbi:hypothetical protein ACFX13_026597 [Malus domestica]